MAALEVAGAWNFLASLASREYHEGREMDLAIFQYTGLHEPGSYEGTMVGGPVVMEFRF
jgi:hypothetical protein